MNEKLIERKLREAVKKRGGIALKFGTMYHTGMPDRIVLTPGGKTSFAELKTTGRKPNPIQRVAIQNLRDLGFVAEVIDSQDTLDDFLKKL